MTNYIRSDLRNADEVIEAFSNATIEFDQIIFQQYLLTYPQYAERLKRYAQAWLLSTRASEEEINSQDIPLDEMLPIQSRLLALWQKSSVTEFTNDEQEALRRLTKAANRDGIASLTRKVLKSESEEEEPLMIEYFRRGLEGVPRFINARLGHELNCGAGVLLQALSKYRTASVGNQMFHSADAKPTIRPPRTWREAVEELDVSEIRKSELMADNESV
jgi:hypothetical protein